MEDNERIPETETTVCPETETEEKPVSGSALPAARAEHISAMAKAIAESAPSAQTLRSFKEACEKTRAELNEAAEAGEQGAGEAKAAIDAALIGLSRKTLEKQTAQVQEYESLSAALHAQADRQAALEILSVSVPLIEEEEKQDQVLTEAMAYCKLQQSEELVYTENGAKNRLPVYKATAEAAEKVRTAFVDKYNHQPSRQRLCEELQDACKAEAEKEKIENAACRTAKKERDRQRKAYLAEHPESKKERDKAIGVAAAFMIPALTLLVCMLTGLLKVDGRIVFAFIILLFAGAAGAYLWLKKRLGAVYLAAEADCESLKEAEKTYQEAKKKAKAQTSSAHEAIKRYAAYRKTYLK